MHHPVLSLLLAAVLVSAAPLQAGATSWTEAIAAVEERSEELWQLAKRRGLEGRHLGTSYNELHAKEHSCAILGRMLDKADLIVVLEKETEMDVSATGGQDTGLAAHSLSNWVHNAKRLVAADEKRRIREWNLDCVGAFGIPGSAWIGKKTTSAFLDVDGTILRVLGDVERGFAGELAAVLDQHPDVEYMALGSGGGSVHEAILAGVDIRSRGLNTTL